MSISRRLKSTLFAGLALASAFTLAACSSTPSASSTDPEGGDTSGETQASNDWPDPFVMAIIPSEDRTELEPSDSILLSYLMEEYGLNIEYHLATSYAATIEAQRAGKAHMAQYGPFSYVLAKDSGVDLVPFVTTAEAADAQSGYHSVASVRADSDIESLEDVKGGTVCFVDPGSTSGYLFPSAGLLEVGIDPESDDITALFSGGHDAAVLALVDGQCDLAFSTEVMATETLPGTGQIAASDIKQIWASELIPSSPMTLSGSVPQDLQDILIDTYINVFNPEGMREAGICDEDHEKGFCGLSQWGYIEVDDSVYDGVRAVCDITEAESCAAID